MKENEKPKLTLVRASNPRWGDAKHSFIIIDAEFAELKFMGLHGFMASPDDVEPHGRTLFQDASLGNYGKVADYVPSPPRPGMPSLPPAIAAPAPAKKPRAPRKKKSAKT